MQDTSLLRSRFGLFGTLFGALFGPGFLPESKRFPGGSELAAPCPIPETFTGAQAEWILALHRLHGHDPRRALQILADHAPIRCSAAQAACIEELLALDAIDLRATLVDAMEDCELRHRLRALSERLAFA